MRRATRGGLRGFEFIGKAQSLLALGLVAIAASGACRSAEAASDADGASMVRGVYALEGTDGDIAILSFVDEARYWIWRNAPECAPSGNADVCSEWGRYAIAGGSLTLTARVSGTSRVLPFDITRSAPVQIPLTTTSESTVHLEDNAIAGNGVTLTAPPSTLATAPTTVIAPQVSLAGRVMRVLTSEVEVVKSGVQVLTTCEGREAGSGAIPGAAYPGDEVNHSVFRSGPFAPGGQYDPTTTANTPPGSGSQLLYRNASTAGHSYALLSERLPPGTTYDQANAALQRFNGPTGPAMQGQGDDPTSTSAWVVDPLFNLPIGCVTFERGDGWARNTTQANHPLIGTITRYVVDGGNGSYRILTVGQGQDGLLLGQSTGSDMIDHGIAGARHVANIVGGPDIFQGLDTRLVASFKANH